MENPIPGFERITIDGSRMNGQPCIRGTRLTVRRVLQLVSEYPNREELFQEFPDLSEDDLREALSYAALRIEDRAVELHVSE